MRLILVRHGDPNYELDCLTELGHKQARIVAERLLEENIENIAFDVVAEREKNIDLRDPLVVMLLAVDDFQASMMVNDALASIIAKGKKLDIYFLIQMDSPNCDFFRNMFRSSRSANAQLVKDAIILSDGDVHFESKENAEKTFAPSLTAKAGIEALSNIISNSIVNSYTKALDANPLDPSFAFLVDDGIINKIKYRVFRDDFVETLVKEFANG